jgi:membrane protein DedA with SNARE-associated domain
VGGAAAAAAGVAASHGRLNLAAVVLVTVAAAEVGGLIGYEIGLRWGRTLVQRPGSHQAYREKALAKAEQAYGKWGRVAVFFTPAIMSGTAKMPFRQFVTWNLVDAVGFALLTVAGAYGVGKVLTGQAAARDLAILVVGVCLGAVSLHLARHHHRRWAVQLRKPNDPERSSEAST